MSDGVAMSYQQEQKGFCQACARPTCCWNRRVQSALYHTVSLHPPLDLLPLYRLPSHVELELAFACLDKHSLLALPHDRLHLMRLHVLVFSPLIDT